MSTLMLHAIGGRTAFEPGDRLEATAQWQLDQPPEAIELRLLWHTAGKGDSDVSLVETIRFDAPGQFETRQAEFQLPWGPYSFSGRLITLAWKLEMVMLPSQESTSLDLVIAPGAQGIQLPTLDLKENTWLAKRT